MLMVGTLSQVSTNQQEAACAAGWSCHVAPELRQHGRGGGTSLRRLAGLQIAREGGRGQGQAVGGEVGARSLVSFNNLSWRQ